jgi:predicted aspartyl protease
VAPVLRVLAVLAAAAVGSSSPLRASIFDPGAPCFTQIGAPVSVPADVTGHAMFVDVMVNGRGPFRMLVDTGCSFTLVSPRLAAAVSASASDPASAPFYGENGLGDPARIRRVLLQTVDVGGARFEGVPACVSTAFDFFSKISGRRVDGTLGYPLFADLYVALDYPGRRLLLSQAWPIGIPPVRAELPVSEMAEVPFVPVRVQGRTVQVMIDTGANQDLELPDGWAPAMRWTDAPRPGFLVAVVGEVARERIGRLAGNLRLGAVRQAAPATEISNGPPAIGVRLLENFCVVFHESEDRMWLCSTGSAPVPSPVVYSVGLSLIPERSGWRVAGVIPGSPAERAHLNPGQLVTRIEGRPARDWTRDQIQHWIDVHSKVALAVADSSGSRDVSLPVWPLVP